MIELNLRQSIKEFYIVSKNKRNSYSNSALKARAEKKERIFFRKIDRGTLFSKIFWSVTFLELLFFKKTFQISNPEASLKFGQNFLKNDHKCKA